MTEFHARSRSGLSLSYRVDLTLGRTVADGASLRLSGSASWPTAQLELVRSVLDISRSQPPRLQQRLSHNGALLHQAVRIGGLLQRKYLADQRAQLSLRGQIHGFLA
jgi:hypothetical protein